MSTWWGSRARGPVQGPAGGSPQTPARAQPGPSAAASSWGRNGVRSLKRGGTERERKPGWHSPGAALCPPARGGSAASASDEGSVWDRDRGRDGIGIGAWTGSGSGPGWDGRAPNCGLAAPPAGRGGQRRRSACRPRGTGRSCWCLRGVGLTRNLQNLLRKYNCSAFCTDLPRIRWFPRRLKNAERV